MSSQVRLHLRGANASPGHVAASDVARAILGLERALAYAVELIAPTSRRRGATGRRTGLVERASQLRFVSTSTGSFITTLSLPEGPADQSDSLPIDIQTVSSLAFEKILDTIRDKDQQPDTKLAGALALLSEELGVGDRTTQLLLEALDVRQARPTEVAIIDRAVRIRMREASRGAVGEARNSKVSGVLFEADFERQQARLRSATGEAVVVSFSHAQADKIQEALRNTTLIEGHALYDIQTGQVTSVQLHEIHRGEQLVLGIEGNFNQHLSIAELQETQGVTGYVDLDDIYDADATDAEAEAYIQAVTKW